MPELPVLSGIEVVQALARLGFVERRQSVSHRVLHHPQTSRTVPVPIHVGRDLKPGTLRAITRQAGLTVEQSIELL